ncbi:MAG: 16S rRNA (cytosine(1402)-N(4))-methyltransferase RsmH [Chitinophagia bacterium]|nr:16S rRNA (cytosine(1402)-N(4))-methyltransferase RsmH [Chitinophagia bacterium]
MTNKTYIHTPVLLHEAVNALCIVQGGTYVDATFGGGGYSRLMLQYLGENGKLIVFDQDADAIANVPEGDKRVVAVNSNFRHLSRYLRYYSIMQVDGIVVDLGVSSWQIDNPERGFSTRYDGALDMRMDRRNTKTAADILNNYSESELSVVFSKYGEVRNARQLAAFIVENRKGKKITSTEQFNAFIMSMMQGNPHKYLAQVYMALRIEVNAELEALSELLVQAANVLKVGGRLAVVSFHSLEDRIVKNFFNTGTPTYYSEHFKEPLTLRVLTPKPIVPSKQELNLNNRSRSAKLRIVEKL